MYTHTLEIETESYYLEFEVSFDHGDKYEIKHVGEFTLTDKEIICVNNILEAFKNLRHDCGEINKIELVKK